MNTIYLGMPGTGKSTACKNAGKCITFDFGKTTDIDSRVFSKMTKLLSSLYENFDNIGFDTYPEYFVELPRNAKIYIAIPEDISIALRRVMKRDGKDSPFFKLYTKNAEKWRTEWINKTQKYRSWKNVTFLDFYDNHGKFTDNVQGLSKK